MYRYSLLVLIMTILSVSLYAQKQEVTTFLGIPVDGYKSEMIQKLKAKGFTINPYKSDVLDGEFNGTDVNIFIGTNNNKVWRIAIADANDMSEGDIRIRFNNLLRQFQNNRNYLPTPDSTILKYSIPESEDISYEMTVNNKRYEAAFYQKTTAYDSLSTAKDILIAKNSRDENDTERILVLIKELMIESLKSLEKTVWFIISKRAGKYYITMFYENEYNKANGEDL